MHTVATIFRESPGTDTEEGSGEPKKRASGYPAPGYPAPSSPSFSRAFRFSGFISSDLR